MTIFTYRPNDGIAQESVSRYGGMIDSCYVRELCRCVESVRRRHGGTVAQWYHGDAPNGTVAPWCYGGAPGGTAAPWYHGEMVWHMARWDAVAGGKVG